MIKVMINGLPGNVAKETAEAAIARGLELLPYSLTGEQITDETIKVGEVEIKLLRPSERESKIAEIKAEFGEFITVDYTHPTAVNLNAEFYIAHNLPFVMGTTGGDREKLFADVRVAELPCIIAPNMAKQIVALQFMLSEMQKNFPDLYKNYSLSCVESHQKTKADTSGTAKAIIDTLNKTGVKQITYDDIKLIREEKAQVEFGVPQAYLGGHAFHTYRLESEDKTVAFEFRHNVCGRSIYADGTIDAVLFLANNLSAKKCFTMIDVLRAGAMGAV